jgi:8-oxo-dGTP diphosphatase
MGYDPRAYDPFAVTVDIVALTIRDGDLHVLLVKRGEAPYKGWLALPGGFVRRETLDEAAARELAEETGLRPGHERLRRVHLEQLRTYGEPGRDPRMRVVSVAYLALGADLPDPVAGGDAAMAVWLPVDAVGRLAFDHATILADGLERARAKLEYTSLATSFLPKEFTIAALRGVYAAVWGSDPHPGNFHRKVLSTPGFVVDAGALTDAGGSRGGRRARLYRAGDATALNPPLTRPAMGVPS